MALGLMAMPGQPMRANYLILLGIFRYRNNGSEVINNLGGLETFEAGGPAQG